MMCKWKSRFKRQEYVKVYMVSGHQSAVNLSTDDQSNTQGYTLARSTAVAGWAYDLVSIHTIFQEH